MLTVRYSDSLVLQLHLFLCTAATVSFFLAFSVLLLLLRYFVASPMLRRSKGKGPPHSACTLFFWVPWGLRADKNNGGGRHTYWGLDSKQNVRSQAIVYAHSFPIFFLFCFTSWETENFFLPLQIYIYIYTCTRKWMHIYRFPGEEAYVYIYVGARMTASARFPFLWRL